MECKINRHAEKSVQSQNSKDTKNSLIELSKRNDILPKGPLSEALSYALSQKSSTAAWSEHGEIELDNNGVEPERSENRQPRAARRASVASQNCIRPNKFGAKNWLFIGGRDTGWRTAAVYTMIENIRCHGKCPRAYLEWVFERLPAMTNQQDLRDLLSAAQL